MRLPPEEVDQTNVVRRAHTSGGLIPKLTGANLHRALAKSVNDLNGSGYRVIVIIPDEWSIVDHLLSLLVLCLCLFLYTFRPGLLIVAEHEHATQGLVADEVRRLRVGR